MRSGVALAAAALLPLCIVAPRASARHIGGSFLTPSRNIACEVDDPAAVGPFSGRRALFCVVFSASSQTRGQRTWTMTPTSSARVVWIAANIATESPVLAYGRTWRYRGFTCRSRRVGLTCRNRRGHGFFLSRERRRIF